MVAIATDFASSKCYESKRYSFGMSPEELQEYRKARLLAAVDQEGGESKGRAKLGRLLGWKTGKQVEHMLNGVRPITEKFIMKFEALDGYAGWFDRPKLSDQAYEAGAMLDRVPESKRDILFAQWVYTHRLTLLGQAFSIAAEKLPGETHAEIPPTPSRQEDR